jgi:hypothetical protein
MSEGVFGREVEEMKVGGSYAEPNAFPRANRSPRLQAGDAEVARRQFTSLSNALPIRFAGAFCMHTRCIE